MPSAPSAWAWGNSLAGRPSAAKGFFLSCTVLALVAGLAEAAERSLRLAPHLGKLNPDGSFGLVEAVGNGFDRAVTNLILQPDGKLLVLFVDPHSIASAGEPTLLARLLPDGQADPSFHPDRSLKLSGSYSSFSSIALQRDGKILLSGDFQLSGEETRRYLVRLQPDGTLDREFLSNALPIKPSDEISLEEGPEAYRKYEILNEIHTYDSTGNPTQRYVINLSPLNRPVKKIAVQQNGEILLALERQQPDREITLIRLNTDGTVDETFRSSAEATLSQDPELFVQPDGKILVAGTVFIKQSPGSVARVFRLNPNGAPDRAFAPVRIEGRERDIAALALKKDGRILLGGSFDSVNGISSPGLARLKPDGRVDSGFHLLPEGTRVFALLTQRDGGLIIGGNFRWGETSEASCNHIARLLEDGSLEGTFARNAAGGFNGPVLCLASTEQGEILAGGEFDSVQNPPAAFPQYNRCTGPGQCVAVPAILGSWDVVNRLFAEEMKRYYQWRNAAIDGIWQTTPKPKATCVNGVCTAEKS